MQTNQRIVEIVGKPGKAWGDVIIPASGTITLQIVGDLVQATMKNGFEKSTSWTRIQNIDSVEITEAPNYLLLAIGVFLVLTGLGIANGSAIFGLVVLAIAAIFIFFAFREKRRLLVIHSLRHTVPVFMVKPPELYQQFAANIMAIARQLNAPAPVSQAGKPALTKSTNSATPESRPVNR